MAALAWLAIAPSAGATGTVAGTAQSGGVARTGGGDHDSDNESDNDNNYNPGHGDDDCGGNESDNDRDNDNDHDSDHDNDHGSWEHDSDDDCEPDPCDEYSPRHIAVAPANPYPGQSISVTGSATPGTPVTIKVTRAGSPPIVTTTAAVPPSGNFVKTFPIPASAPPGNYVLTVASPHCPTPVSILLRVRYQDNRCSDYKEVFVHRGWNVTWKLLALGQFNPTKNVKLTLIPQAGGTSRVVFNNKPPSNGRITFKFQNSWALGWYTISESGIKKNTTSTALTANCGRMLVVPDGDNSNDDSYRQALAALLVSSTGPLPPQRGPSGDSAPGPRALLAVGVALVAANSLRVLSRRRFRRT